MNELEMLEQLYEEPPAPTSHARAAARLRMTGEPPVRRRTRGTRLTLGLGGLVAAAAAAAVAVAALGTGSPAPQAKPTEKLSARAVLLAAAEKAELAPTGRYWYSDSVSGQSYIVRAKTGAYAIVGAHFEFFKWAGRKKGDGTAFYGREIPAKPLTKQDEAAWRTAGSPSSFRVFSNDHYWTYTRKATQWEIDDPDPNGGGEFFIMGTGRSMTAEQIMKLPTDPARLAEMFLVPQPGPKVPKDLPADQRRELAEKAKARKVALLDTPGHRILRLAHVLQDAPLPPQVRAGLMRALAGQPGIAAVGTATDPLGRRGVALAAQEEIREQTGQYGAPREDWGEYGVRQEIILDPENGQLLAQRLVLTKPGGPYKSQRPGFVVNYDVLRASGWTDDRPKPPAKLPF